ncbi:MAG TPA: LysM peptidoglycan-binding domain-containing protein [Streptosporangiaceae bacterium]|nr:LysM peptidoglycan-binding domain-containing protein [Streptosporangiaceae bacterium]
MSALSAIEAALVAETPAEDSLSESARRAAQRRRLQVVTGAAGPAQPPLSRSIRASQGGRAGGLGAASGGAASGGAPAGRTQPAQAPLRLTRRGRVVASALGVVLAAVALTIISMAAPGGAQAANHGRPGAGYQGMRQIVVRPGQTLWSIATTAEPSADPRLVIARIMAANSMTSTAVQAGEELWVPR